MHERISVEENHRLAVAEKREPSAAKPKLAPARCSVARSPAALCP